MENRKILRLSGFQQTFAQAVRIVAAAAHKRRLASDAVFYKSPSLPEDGSESLILLERATMRLHRRIRLLTHLEAESDWAMGAAALVGRENASDSMRVVLSILATARQSARILRISDLCASVDPLEFHLVLDWLRADGGILRPHVHIDKQGSRAIGEWRVRLKDRAQKSFFGFFKTDCDS